MTNLFGALRLPASVVFGSGQRAALGMMAAQLGKRALVCTDARMGSDAQFQRHGRRHRSQRRPVPSRST